VIIRLNAGQLMIILKDTWFFYGLAQRLVEDSYVMNSLYITKEMWYSG
jgi:hypothetical protein